MLQRTFACAARICTAVIPLAVPAAHVAAADAAPPPGRVLFDVDFTQGLGQLPPGAKVLGGEWRHGWRVTDNGQRLVLDPGRPVKNGRLEVTLTRYEVTNDAVAYLQPALNWRAVPVSIHELETLAKPTGVRADSFRIQVGNHEQPGNIQGVIRAGAQEEGGARWMQNFGRWSDWICDDRTPQTLALEWRNGIATVHDVTGKAWTAPKPAPLDALRYVALGGDNETIGSALGVRFLRARLIDLDLPPQFAAPPLRRRVVFDVDLTQGAAALPAAAAVLGGQWDEGWRVTGNQQRIVLDAGYPIRNGCLELKMTRKRTVQTAQKMNAFGLYEHAAIDQAGVHGDIFYVRIGMTEISQGVQGNVKAFGRVDTKPGDNLAHAGMHWEERFGKFADWVLDDKTPVTMKLEWKNGNAFLTEIKGRVLTCPNGCAGSIDALRYAVLGGDRYDGGGSLVGLRFLAAKLTDYDAPEVK
jgi:hypothetical protein